MTLEPVTDRNPTEPGDYCVRQWYCWRVLQWHDGKWWHPGLVAKWPVGVHGETALEAWIGPLPMISKDYTKKVLELPPTGPEPAYKPIKADPPALEYDL